MRFKQYLRMSAATALVVIISNPAFALDGDDLIAKITAAFAAQGGELTVEDVTVDGSTVVAKGMMLTPSGQRKDKIPLGEVKFEGVEEQDGGYHVDTVYLSDVDVAEKGTHITASGLEIDGLRVPAKIDMGSLDGIVLYDAIKSGPISVEVDGKKVASIDSSVAKIMAPEDKSEIAIDAKIAGVNLDLSGTKSPKSKAVIKALELQNVSGNIDLSGSWEPETGKLEISEYALDFNDIGKLDVKASISGYTLQFVKALQEAQAAMADNPDKKAANQAFGLTMMGLMQQLSVNGASVRFEDASITNRVLDYIGQQQGVSGKQMAQSLKAMAPIMLARLNMPEFQAQISAALGKFLDDPQSIEIKANPAQPVAVPTIMGAAMGAPQTIPQVLGVTISANE